MVIVFNLFNSMLKILFSLFKKDIEGKSENFSKICTFSENFIVFSILFCYVASELARKLKLDSDL